METSNNNDKKSESEEDLEKDKLFSLDEFKIGDVLNYGRVLENGKQTRVRICMHVDSKTFYCIKMEPYLDEEQKQRLLKKGHMQKSASHPGIVRLFSSFTDEKWVYHLMEYLPGGDLFDMVTAIGALPEEMAKIFASQLILAVEFLHSQNILHNDIKLENLVLNNVDKMKLTDFGLATYESERTSANNIINGTPGYMAPEIIMRKPPSKESDWWCVGICIYEMLVGSLPFGIDDSEMTVSIFQKILHSELIIPNNVSPKATDVIRRLLHPDGQQRLGSGGVEEIKSCPWFADIDWDTVYTKNTSSEVHFVRKLEEARGSLEKVKM